MHHNLHKTNYILSKFLLFFPKQVRITSETTGPGLIPEARRETLIKRPPQLSSDNRSRINTRSQTGNPIRTITSYPPITSSGLTPEAQQGNHPHMANYYPLRVVSTKNYSDSFLLSRSEEHT